MGFRNFRLVNDRRKLFLRKGLQHRRFDRFQFEFNSCSRLIWIVEKNFPKLRIDRRLFEQNLNAARNRANGLTTTGRPTADDCRPHGFLFDAFRQIGTELRRTVGRVF